MLSPVASQGYLRGVPQEARPCHHGKSFPGICTEGSSPFRVLQPPPPPASFSGVLSEENSLTAREDTEVISGAIFDHLVYLMHA